MWIDRELDRVLRFEQIATEIPTGFPITAASSLIDYDWVSINERKYLLPFHSEIMMTSARPNMVLQSRNDVRFRNYQKFGAELKVVDEVGEDDERETAPATPPSTTPGTQTNKPVLNPVLPMPKPSPSPEPASDGAPPIPKLKKP